MAFHELQSPLVSCTRLFIAEQLDALNSKLVIDLAKLLHAFDLMPGSLLDLDDSKMVFPQTTPALRTVECEL
jgi:hypothetical protein